MSVSSYLNQVMKQRTFDIIRHRGPEMTTSNIQVGDVIRVESDLLVGEEYVVPFGLYLIVLSDDDGTVILREIDSRGRAGEAYEFNDNDLIGPTSEYTGFVVYGSVPLLGVPEHARDGAYGRRRAKRAARRRVTKKRVTKKKVTKKKATKKVTKRKAAKRAR